MRPGRGGTERDAPPADLAGIDWGAYDFLDVGCSSGGSLEHCARRFGARRGLGVDLSEEKVAAARARGLHAVRGDVRDLRGAGLVRFVSMMQFLEHLPDLDSVRAILARSAELATDFLYVHHPSFDDEHFLLSQGLRLYYHDWSGHRCHALTTDLLALFESLGLRRYFVRPLKPVFDSGHPAVIPATADRDQHEYDAARHGPKPAVRFGKPVFQHVEFFVPLRSIDEDAWRAIVGAPPAAP
jgi:SAM-dependent methyltransferase